MMSHRSLTGFAALFAVLIAFPGVARPVKADVVVYVTGTLNEFGTLDLATGTFQQLGTVTTQPNSDVTGMGFGADGSLYAVDNSFDSHLYRINALNGATTDLGSLGQSAFAGGANAQGTLFVLSQDQPSTLYSVNAPSVATTTIGMPNFFPDGLLAVAPNGDIYASAQAATTGPDSLYRIDHVTGIETLVGSIGDFAFSGVFVGNTLYAFDDTSHIITIDTTTGQSTVVGSFSIPGSQWIFGAAVGPQAVPEPSVLALVVVGAGVLGLARVWRRLCGIRAARPT
jgi:hypothetical protein